MFFGLREITIVLGIFLASSITYAEITHSSLILGAGMVGLINGRDTKADEFPFVYPLFSYVRGAQPGVLRPSNRCAAIAINQCVLAQEHCFAEDEVKHVIHTSDGDIDVEENSVERLAKGGHPWMGDGIAVARLSKRPKNVTTKDILEKKPVALPQVTDPDFIDNFVKGQNYKVLHDHRKEAVPIELVGYTMSAENEARMQNIISSDRSEREKIQLVDELLRQETKQQSGSAGLVGPVSRIMPDETRNSMSESLKKIESALARLTELKGDKEQKKNREEQYRSVAYRLKVLLEGRGLIYVGNPAYSEEGDSGGPAFHDNRLVGLIHGGPAKPGPHPIGVIDPIADHYDWITGKLEKLGCL
jgi:Trypsin